MNIIKVLAVMILSMSQISCMVVPPEMNSSSGIYSNNPPPVIVQQPNQQPVIIQQPTQPVIIHQPDNVKQHCYDSQTGEYLKVPPHSNRCREWLRNNQKEREKRHLCIDRKNGHYVHGVPANSPECHRINHPPHRHEPPRHQPPPVQQPIRQPVAPVKRIPILCIDKRTGKPVAGVSANDLRCAKINR
jgi:hypothetical protein